MQKTTSVQIKDEVVFHITYFTIFQEILDVLFQCFLLENQAYIHFHLRQFLIM